MRPFLSALAVTSAGLLAAGGATAAEFPSKPITVVVPFPPGGTPDIIARVLSEDLRQRLGQTVLVENRPGASGNIGAQAVARAEPDGYTLLMCAFTCPVSPSLYSPPPYDIAKDFAPVTLVGTVPSVLVVHPDVPARTVAELLDHARQHPDRLNFASSGIGGSAHLAAELLKKKTGVRMTHIPYKGAGQVAADLLGGQVDMYFDNLPASLASIRAGKLRALAVASAERSSSIPDVPTFAEAGVPDFRITPWFGIMAPAGTPAPVVTRLNTDLVAALRSPAVSDRLGQLGVQIVASTPEELGRFVAAEATQWKTVIDDNQIRAE